MEQQQNDSAETDAEKEQLSRPLISFNTIKELKQNYGTISLDQAKHLIKVMDVFEIVKSYLFNGCYSSTRKLRIAGTIMSFLPSQSWKKDIPQESMPYPFHWCMKKDPQESMPYPFPWCMKKDPQETLQENPGAASHTSRKITLGSSDGELFEVDEAVVLESIWMKYYIDWNCADNGIPLPEVTSKILSKVIEYCKKHVESRKSDCCTTGTVDDDLKAWDAEFVKLDQDTLFDLIRAAHYLDIKSLSKLTVKTFLDMSRGDTQEEFKRKFKLLTHTF